MIISVTATPMLAVSNSMANMMEAYERYRKAMEALAAIERQWKQNQMLRELTELRHRYLAAYEALIAGDERDAHFKANSRYLLHIRKTIAGLGQLILRHAVRKLWSSHPPLSLLLRVRQITATHPAIAPPQFA